MYTFVKITRDQFDLFKKRNPKPVISDFDRPISEWYQKRIKAAQEDAENQRIIVKMLNTKVDRLIKCLENERGVNEEEQYESIKWIKVFQDRYKLPKYW